MKTIFLCGHKSPFGRAHLVPLLTSDFNVSAVVIATDKRWGLFRESLAGKDYYPQSHSLIERIKRSPRKFAKQIIPEGIIRKIREDYKKQVDVQEIVKEHRIPIWHTDNVNSEQFVERVRKTHVDLILSAAYPQIFSKKLISIAAHGAVNFHPSLLPKFRGAYPHYWSIVRGEEKSGLTAHFMTEHIDDGDIIAQIEYPIGSYNLDDLYDKIIRETPRLIKKVEEFFLEGDQVPTPQNSTNASYFREPREIHNRIFWGIHSASDISNLVRGQKAFCFFRTERIAIRECNVTPGNRNLTNSVEVENGTIVDLGEKSIAVKVKDGVINVTKVYVRKKMLSAPDFIRKFRIFVGEKFD